MAFPRKLLNDGEEVVLDLRPHWSKLVWPVLLVVALIAAAVAAVALADVTALEVGLAAALVLAALFLLARYAKWTTTSFVVTTERLIHRRGVVAKQGIEIPLDRVQTIRFAQTAFERLLGSGDLIIESGGEQGQSSFADIRKPMVVQSAIYRQMEAYENVRADRMAGARPGPSLSVPEQLETLHRLLQQGAITPAEYEAQKARLLS